MKRPFAGTESGSRSSGNGSAVTTTSDPQRKRFKRRRCKAWLTLSEEQRAVVRAACDNTTSALFITGGAGVGKSTVLRVVMDALRERGVCVHVTGSTGVAASNVGGTTLHTFGGIGLGQGTAEQLLRDAPGLRPHSKAWRRWRAAQTLVIDEVSMLSGALLDKLDAIARAVRGRPQQPFGGLRLIFCGDPLQLPPVPDMGASDVPFFFESPCWRALCVSTHTLPFSYRQEGDAAYAAVLNELRMGACSPETQRVLEARLVSRLPPLPPGAIVIRLLPYNNDVDAYNARRLRALPGNMRVFRAEDDGEEQHLKHLLVPHELELKVGAQVMLVKNVDVDGGLFNGLQGVVTAFTNGLPEVRFENARVLVLAPEEFTVERDREVVATRRQVPLRLSWATTIHKSQAATIASAAEIDAGAHVFAPGMTYVALSRLQRLDQVRLLAFAPSAVKAHPRVVAWLREQEAPKQKDTIRLTL